MNNEIINLLNKFNFNNLSNKIIKFNLPYNLPNDYIDFLEITNGGNGFIGNEYVQFWTFEDIVELNQDYAVNEFIPGIVLVGSNGSDLAYGIQKDGTYIEVPFIGMNFEEVKIIANTFDELIKYINTKL